MKQNIKTYVDIEEVELNEKVYYSASFTEEYNLVICGLNLGAKSHKTEIPFLFKTLEIAKDFCQFKPKFKWIRFCNNESYGHLVTYETYSISINDKIFYIKWSKESIILNTEDMNDEFIMCSNPIVDKFVTDIKLDDWLHTNDMYDIEFINERSSLSALIAVPSKNLKKWHFELVENNEN